MIDNRLREASPDTVLKDSNFLDIGGLNNAKYRAILFFDFKEYAEKTINSAVLLLYWYYAADKTRANDTTIEVYRPASPWNPDKVTWKSRDENVPWSKAGGDWYDKNGVLQGGSPYATFTIKGSAVPDNKYYELDVTELVKEYASGKYTNTGLLIKAKTESNNYIAFYSSEAGTGTYPPLLRIETGEPPKSEAYVMIICPSYDDAKALCEDLQTHIWEREIKVFNEA